ncbi:hypothetical protein Y032_0164g3546 [Ancylostoma ceylanicum]|uniref:Uncharacterized protein n=1 Tax=Ancylostoma ceylanicum TaxID=53326 RepID=A0A016SXE4_9BILA|nr:hypothetical protein Y032_0164g3546 [Ancylostoma ceylanicum]
MSDGQRKSRRHIASLEQPWKAATFGHLSKDGQMWPLSVAVECNITVEEENRSMLRMTACDEHLLCFSNFWDEF